MKGKLVKRKEDWFLEYIENGINILMPLHPSELNISGLWRLKNKEVEFDIRQEYKGMRRAGTKDSITHVEIYQNYAKLKID